MREVPHWREPRPVRLASSVSGVLVTTHPDDNLVRSATAPWPTPELLQKYCASLRFRGATPEDDHAARSGLGDYCDLQSLNSEDAVTWSVFGSLAYLAEPERTATIGRLFRLLGLSHPRGNVITWLWRRLPHPEKPESNGGPEIDFGFLSDEVFILGEAKWNSPLGTGQGVAGDQSQLDIRLGYMSHLAKRALPRVEEFIVLGIARSAGLLAPSVQPQDGISVQNLTWDDAVKCFEGALGEELQQYHAWRSTYGKRMHPAATPPYQQSAGREVNRS